MSGFVRLSFVLGSMIALAACGGRDGGGGTPPLDDGGTVTPDAGPMGLAVLGHGTHALADLEVATIATADHGLNVPRDVAFHPDVPTQLWIVNFGDTSTTILVDVGTETQDWRKRNAFGAAHFLARPSALAFGAPGYMATIHEMDEPTQSTTPSDFMGPTLWPSSLEDYDGGHASHLDMLHNSPNGVGIAWERDNVYWVFDGFHGSLTRYDFQADHGPGQEDHSDGIITRYVEGQVAYVAGVSSHLEMDRATGLLYVADSGNARIAVLDTATGTPGGRIGPNYDGAEMSAMLDAVLTTLVDGNALDPVMVRPSGLALHDGMVFVSDNETSRIYAFDLTGQLVDWLDVSPEVGPGGLQGIDFDPEGRLHVVDSAGNRILRIAPRPL